MSSDTTAPRPGGAMTIPLRRALVGLARGPLQALETVSRQAQGAVVRLDLGPFRPYLITRPEHIQHVLRENAANYRRDGMMWKPLRRLLGNGLAGEGPVWAEHRRIFQPLFAARYVASLVDRMADAINAAVGRLDEHARTGRPVDACGAMTRVVHRAFSSVFFGGRMSTQDTDVLGRAVGTALTNLGPRMLLPFVSDSVPLPGDGAYRRAGRRVDEVMLPLIGKSRHDGGTGDLVSVLCDAHDEHHEGFGDRQVRDDLIAIFAAGTESTALTLTWLWVVLDAYPQVAAELRDEVDRVVGTAAVQPAHLAELTYTKMVLQEVLRLYPAGWIIPRAVVADDVVGGVPVKGGSTVVLSPYLTHRMESHWPHPDVFDPQRFGSERSQGRHRFAYVPFGAGPHMCLGSHLFTVEAQLVVAAVLSRYRMSLHGGNRVTPRAAASLQPRRRVWLTLRPVRRAS
jgi:cytochrome P450